MSDPEQHPDQSNPEHILNESNDTRSSLTRIASPFSMILESNHAASDTEAIQIEQIVIEHNEDIARIDQEMDRLQHRRAALLASKHAHQGLLSPIRRTPPELLAKIFILCLPVDQFVMINVLDAPLLLAQICRRWREIVLSTPRLWNSLCVVEHLLEELIPFNRILLIKVWLSRSGNLPLSISINGFHNSTNPQDLMDVLIPFASRWSNLALHLPQPLVEWLLCNSDVSTSPLETLSLTITTSLVEGNPLMFTPTASRLRNITVSVDSLIPPLLKFPWSQLTELRSGGILEMQYCFDIFRLCPSLTHLSLRNIQDPSDAAGRPVVTMPRLSWLELGAWHSALGPLLDNLAVPSLLYFSRTPLGFGAMAKKRAFGAYTSLIVSPQDAQHFPEEYC